MLVNREQTAAGAAGYNRAWGVDANVNLLGNLVLTGYAARTDDAQATGDSRSAAMVQAAWRDPLWDASVLAKHVGRDFEPGVGFVDRTGVRRLFATVGAHPQPAGLGPIAEVNPYLDVDVYTNLDGALETRTITPTLDLVFDDGGTLHLEASDRFERLFAPASIAGAALEPGTYEWREVQAAYTVSGSHRVSGTFSAAVGDFFDGSRTSLGARVRVRPDPRFNLDLEVERNDLELGGRTFTADLYSARVRWSANVRTFLMGFVQYNESTDELITNARFNLIHAPLSDLFLVLTERRALADDAPEAVIERGITLKVTRLLAF
jgi:hypothetical protein